ncbi:hypothetical protein [Nostoc sp.]|uniref:hypothetical protein n=1 Tax=Nostoc sp. TaxID=1180 RepID=UPI002FF6DC2B
MNQTKNKNNRGTDTRTFIRVLYWAAVICGIWFAYLNIQPYATAVKMIISGAAADTALLQLIYSIPLIGPTAATVGTALHWLVGLVIWVVVQTVEVFPIILKRDRAFMRTLINNAQSADKFEIRENDDPALAALKRWYNAFPTLTMTTARNLALFVYAIDFCFCALVYPPCKGGFGQLMFILASGQWGQIDWKNVTLLIVTLFAIEAIIHLIFWLGEIAYFMRASHSR